MATKHLELNSDDATVGHGLSFFNYFPRVQLGLAIDDKQRSRKGQNGSTRAYYH